MHIVTWYMIFFKWICSILCLLKMTYLNPVSVKDNPFKQNSDWLTPLCKAQVLLHTECTPSALLSRIRARTFMCLRKVPKLVLFFHKRAMQLLKIITLQHDVSYPWWGVHIIQSTMQLRFLLTQPRGLTPSQLSKFLMYFWQTKPNRWGNGAVSN